MNERGFKAKLRKLIKPVCHIQDMSSLGTRGTPDLWVSGNIDVWVEVKYDAVTKGAIKPKLSPLQLDWLVKRKAEGRAVCVVVGTAPDEGVIFWDDFTVHSNERVHINIIISQLTG